MWLYGAMLAALVASGICNGSAYSIKGHQQSVHRKLRQVTSSQLTATTTASSFPKCLAAIKGLRVVYPGSSTFTAASSAWNLRTLAKPAAVTYPKSTADVSAIVRCCVRNGKQAVARGGGHSYAGYSEQRNKVTVDMKYMNQVKLASDKRTATIGSGALLGPVYLKLWQQSGGTLGMAAGTCPTVGIAGFILGGGFGMSSRKYGISSDRLVSLTLVNAKGNIITADASHNADLFWASKGGGGGNFGIVTSFKILPIDVRGGVTVAFMQWPASKYAAVTDWYLRNFPNFDPGFSSDLFLGYEAIRIHGVYYGPPAKVKAAFDATGVSRLGKAQGVRFESMSWIDAMAEFANRKPYTAATLGLTTELTKYYFNAKSNYISAPISAKGLAITAAAVKSAETLGVNGWLQFHAYGGAIDNVKPSDTAFVHRNKLANLQYYTSWTDTSKAAKSTKWLQDTWSKLQPYVENSAYQNYIDEALGAASLNEYYGANLQRLTAVKRKYDPGNFFNYPYSIPVAKS